MKIEDCKLETAYLFKHDCFGNNIQLGIPTNFFNDEVNEAIFCSWTSNPQMLVGGIYNDGIKIIAELKTRPKTKRHWIDNVHEFLPEMMELYPEYFV